LLSKDITRQQDFFYGKKSALFECESAHFEKVAVLRRKFFIGILTPFIIDPKESSVGPNRGDSGLKPRFAVSNWQLGGRGVAIIITGPDIDRKIR